MDTPLAPPPSPLPADLLAPAAVAQASPDRVALVAACGTLRYGELHARASKLAAWLRARGVGPEALVGICLERSFDQITVALAAWQAGGAYLPLDPHWPDARLRTIVADAACTVVIGDAAAAARLPDVDVTILDWATLPDTAIAPAVVTADALAYVIYTSGTTGTPKGVEITHGNLAHMIAWHNAAFAVTADDRATHLAGLGFDAAVWEVWPYLAAGASLTLLDERARTSAPHLKAALLDHRITIAFAPTSLAQELIAAEWPADTALRYLLTGADRLLVHPPAGLPFAFVNNYGPTECTVVATSATIAPGVDDGLPPIGRAIAGATVHILDGEILVGGGGVGRGYRHQPALTAEKFVTHPTFGRLYRTGDTGAWTADGQIAFHGRIDDQVKVRGHRVEPEEVASLLRRQPNVRAAAVVLPAGGDSLVAYVVPEGDATAQGLRAALLESLPDYMVPTAFLRLDALPLTASGKLDKAALPAPDAATALGGGASFAAPDSPVEAKLADILADVLGRGPVGRDDNFFLLGGHSLLGTQVVLRAGEAFGIDLTLRDLFLAPTIRFLGDRIETLVFAMIEAMSDDEAQLRAAE